MHIYFFSHGKQSNLMQNELLQSFQPLKSQRYYTSLIMTTFNSITYLQRLQEPKYKPSTDL